MPNYTNTHHNYTFEGADDLVNMGSSWFVSYMYSQKIDINHKNWERVRTHPLRINVYNRSLRHHKTFILAIIDMNPDMLNRNTIGLSGKEVITMANLIKTEMGW